MASGTSFPNSVFMVAVIIKLRIILVCLSPALAAQLLASVYILFALSKTQNHRVRNQYSLVIVTQPQ